MAGGLTNKGILRALPGEHIQLMTSAAFINQGAIAVDGATIFLNGAFNCGIAYFCHTAADTCVNDTDCDAGKCQFDSMAGHWHCGCAMCAPPP